MGDLDTDMGLASCTVALCSSSMKESSDRYSVSEFSALTWSGSSSARRFPLDSNQLSLLDPEGNSIDSLLRFVASPCSDWAASSDGRYMVDSRFERRRALVSSSAGLNVCLLLLLSASSKEGARWVITGPSGCWSSASVGGEEVVLSATTVGVLSTDCSSSKGSGAWDSSVPWHFCGSSSPLSSSDSDDGRVDGAPDEP
jgi:hypothetical protein